MDIIEFDSVSFSYDGESTALADVSLHIGAGDFVCLLGANGSGKTTLARHVNALLTPDAGTVRVLGHATHDARQVAEIRSHVGMVFQNPDDQIVASLVEDDIAFGPGNLNVGRDELETRIAEALEKVGLAGFEKREVATLSGGEKQRVAIAGALAMKPDILVLDESTAMLDPANRMQVMRVCTDLNESGIAIVLVTHLLDEAALANRVIVLDEGTVRLDGAASEVLADKGRLEELGLIAPFTRRPRDRTRPADGDRKTVLEIAGASFSYMPEKSARTRAKGNRKGRNGGTETPPWTLKDITLELREGEILGIAGRSGSGKSTLLRLAGKLVEPAEGRVTLRGRFEPPAGDRGRRERHLDIGIVFQHPERQLFAATVFDDVAFGPRNLGLSPEEVEQCAADALGCVGLSLDELRHRSPFSLSGGQQRRVAIAGVLACRPSLLVMDEPTAGLDPRARRSLLELMDRLNCERDLPIMIASHNLDDLTGLCDRIAILEGGSVREVIGGHSKSYKSLAASLNAWNASSAMASSSTSSNSEG